MDSGSRSGKASGIAGLCFSQAVLYCSDWSPLEVNRLLKLYRRFLYKASRLLYDVGNKRALSEAKGGFLMICNMSVMCHVALGFLLRGLDLDLCSALLCPDMTQNSDPIPAAE